MNLSCVRVLFFICDLAFDEVAVHTNFIALGRFLRPDCYIVNYTALLARS